MNEQIDAFKTNGSSPPAKRSGTSALPALMTFAQVADLVQVSPATISRWSLEDASFPVIALPGRVKRVREADLLSWIAARSRRPIKTATS